MIKKVKDLSKVILNKEDVLVKQIVESKKRSIILSDEQQKKLDEDNVKLISMEIIAKGSSVHFDVGDYIETKGNLRVNFEIVDSVEANGIKLEQRVFVIHMNNIEYAVKPENYELS